MEAGFLWIKERIFNAVSGVANVVSSRLGRGLVERAAPGRAALVWETGLGRRAQRFFKELLSQDPAEEMTEMMRQTMT